MARDYKSRPTEKKKKGSSVWSGIMIGLLVGLIAAAAIAFWVGRSNPFAEREASSDKPAAEHGKTDKTNKQIVDPLAKVTAPSDTDKPRFDFYKILPGKEAAVTDQGVKPDQPAKAEEQYFLQAGAFPNPEDADNLKARLALMGFEAAIQTVDIPGKGTWHRVRLGPYKINEANKTRDSLAQNKIDASLVKIKNQNDGTQSKSN